MKVININVEVAKYAFEELSDVDRILVDMARKNTDSSYAPYSNFHVGATMLLADNSIFAGANQENAAFPVGTCAERAALYAAATARPDVAPVVLAIAARSGKDFTSEPVTPCGMCRQALLEAEQRYASPIRLLLYGTSGTYVVKSVRDLLPLTFDGSALHDE